MFRAREMVGVTRLVSALLLSVAAILLRPSHQPERRSWNDLIAPLRVGEAVTRGYVLSPPYRGEAHDVVFVARRAGDEGGEAMRVEVHVVDRGQWPGVRETRSFGVAWEAPKPGSKGAAPVTDANAVTDAVAQAIAGNDTGFDAVDLVPLASEPERPPAARVLERLTGLRGALVGALVALGIAALSTTGGGPAAVGVVLFGLGLALRAPCLDVPFVHDQDVQRLFTGHLPLREIATGAGLRDRHPPLYFFLLHFVELLGQSEALVRAPAVVAGALAGPALLLSVAAMGRRVGPVAAVTGLVITLSPELVARSREVSEIPLFALLVMAASAAVVAVLRSTRLAPSIAVAIAHALALWTYYLAPFVLAAHASILPCVGRRRRLAAALAVGALAGAPALFLGVATFFRDLQAREVARAFPSLAWGHHTPLSIAAQMGRISLEAVGWPFLFLAFAAVAVGALRRDSAVLTPALAVVSTVSGIALLSLVARVQAYYVVTVLPLVALVVAVAPRPRDEAVWLSALVFTVAVSIAPALSHAGVLYVPSADAFAPGFARAIAKRPESTVITVAHYDRTILSYYLARESGRQVDWSNLSESGTSDIEPLLFVHALNPDSERDGLRRLNEALERGPALIIQRDAFWLPSIAARLSACELVEEAPTARLVRCPMTRGDE